MLDHDIEINLRESMSIPKQQRRAIRRRFRAAFLNCPDWLEPYGWNPKDQTIYGRKEEYFTPDCDDVDPFYVISWPALLKAETVYHYMQTMYRAKRLNDKFHRSKSRCKCRLMSKQPSKSTKRFVM